jgi:hypothetical protein
MSGQFDHAKKRKAVEGIGGGGVVAENFSRPVIRVRVNGESAP